MIVTVVTTVVRLCSSGSLSKHHTRLLEMGETVTAAVASCKRKQSYFYRLLASHGIVLPVLPVL